MKTQVSLLISLVLLCACQPSANATPDPSVTAAAVPFACKTAAPGTLGCLEEACEFAGGAFSKDLRACSCGHYKTFSVENQAPRCTQIKIDNDCLKKPNGFQSVANDELKLSLCSSIVNLNPRNERAGWIYFDLDQSTSTDRTQFLRWADTRFWPDFAYQFWDSPLSQGDYIGIGGRITNNFVIDGLLKPFDVPNEWIDYVNFFPAAKYFASAQDAITYLSKATTRAARNPFGQDRSLLNELMDRYQHAPLDLSYEVESRYEAGCLRSCVARSETLQSNGHQFFFIKYYNAGVVYRSEFVMARDNGQTIASIILADLAPSVFLQFTRSEHGFLLRAEAFDIEGRTLFEKIYGDNSVETKPVLNTNADIKIGLCEDAIQPEGFAKAAMGSSLLMGPHAETYFGWSASPDDYWLGRYSLNNYGNEEIGGRGAHSEKVATVLINTQKTLSKVGLVPLSIKSCIDPKQVANWFPEFKAAGGHVINLSASDEMDRATCAKMLRTHPIQMDPKSVMWVAAAGNVGVNAARGCPQHLVGRPNLMVVGANNGSRMHSQSNYGEMLVDIAAPGESMTGEGWGTSFSAPRVSRVAAELFARYPKLSVAQIKQSIMLGADIPQTPLPVLSQGILNAGAADRIALGLSRNQNIKSILPALFCKGRGDCDLAKVKLQINSKLNLQDM